MISYNTYLGPASCLTSIIPWSHVRDNYFHHHPVQLFQGMTESTNLLESFDSYPFDQDMNFKVYTNFHKELRFTIQPLLRSKGGLEAILAQDTSGLDSETMIGRAKAFYYSSWVMSTILI